MRLALSCEKPCFWTYIQGANNFKVFIIIIYFFFLSAMKFVVLYCDELFCLANWKA